MDDDGYPEEWELEKIRTWSHANGFVCWSTLLEYVRELWRWPDYFRGPDSNGMYELSTGGWSGNENLLAAMEGNRLFWEMCWFSSRRGGHYVFLVKEDKVGECREEV